MNHNNFISNKAVASSKKYHFIKTLLAAAVLTALPMATQAATLTVSVTNLTRGVGITPLLIAAHPATYNIFTEGQPASAGLQATAEGGSTALLQATLTPLQASMVVNPANGLLLAGQNTTTTTFQGGAGTANPLLSVVAMIVPSNDAFVALDGIAIPTTPGTYTYLLNAYDAGTEANNEIAVAGGGAVGVLGMAAPGPTNPGSGATGIPGVVAEGFVHIHRGLLGDTNPTGGLSDANSAVHRWLNPVARVVLTVQ